jgi:hypothetical protein
VCIHFSYIFFLVFVVSAECLRADWSDDSAWNIARMGMWTNSRALHINVDEIVTAGMSVKWMASQPAQSLNKRVIFIGDNQASLGALSKGRSSVQSRNRTCRHVCALVLSAGFVASWVWVRSASNPSDFPSRLPALQRASYLFCWILLLTPIIGDLREGTSHPSSFPSLSPSLHLDGQPLPLPLTSIFFLSVVLFFISLLLFAR